MKYIHANNALFFEKTIPKRRSAIKIYFSREPDQIPCWEKPIATTDGVGSAIYEVPEGYEVHAVLLREPRWFGLLGIRWIECEPYEN